jgi:DNA invertase Pin-like site-specific DNA recombinase
MKPYRYLRYGRMSDRLQNPRSIVQQFDTIARELDRRGYRWVHVADFRDDFISGRLVHKRPGFRQMREDIRTRKIQVDLVLVDTLERFGRMPQLPEIRRELHQKDGVLVLCADAGFADPNSTSGQALGVIETIRATSDAHVKSHNVMRGKRDAAKLKRWPGGPVPLGYRLESIMKEGPGPAEIAYRRLVPNPETVPAIERIFVLADEQGLGTTRIAAVVNEDADFVRRFGKMGASGVGYILRNPIYIGRLRYGRVATDIIDDCRVAQRNKEEDVLFVEEFCAPLIATPVWDRVHEQRRARGERMKEIRAAGRTPNGKLIAPLAPGLTLKFPLSGLVRCGICGAAMTAARSGRTSYYYYRCPAYLDRRCPNKRNVRGDWLVKVTIARLRERLFPLPPAGSTEIPEWIRELADEIRDELRQWAERGQDRRPLLEREEGGLRRKISGWTQSLAKPDLSTSVREHIERELESAMARRQEIEVELQAFGHEREQVETLLDVNAVIARLRRLQEVLESGNPTEVHLGLSDHILEVQCFPNGRVVMRTSRLGIFEGLPVWLTRNAGADGGAADPPGESNRRRRSLPRRQTAGLDGRSAGQSSQPVVIPDGLLLPDKWIDEDIFQALEYHCWAALHAGEVDRLYRHPDERWTQQRLADHFRVSLPTIRSALRHAAKRNGRRGQT